MDYLSWILGGVVALLFGFLAPLEDYREELRSKLLGVQGFGHVLFGNRQTSPFAGFLLAIFTIVRFLLEVPLWVLYWAWRSYYCLVVVAITVGIFSLFCGGVLVFDPASGVETLGPWGYPAAWFYLTSLSLLFFVPAIWGCQAVRSWWTSKQEGTPLKQE